MNRLLLRGVRQAVVGVAVIAVVVPVCQDRLLTLEAARSQGPSLSVTGEVSGLTLGVPGRLLMTVHNDGDAAAVVHHLVTQVRSTVAGCAISVAPWNGTMQVPAGGSASQPVVVRIAGGQCEGVGWDLAYRAT